MEIRKINDEYSVAGQITADDLGAIVDQGFKSIVCHRPDAEVDGQPTVAEIGAAAKARGIEMRHIPVGREGVGFAQVQEFVDALDEMDRPMLGYCRSGARSTTIYQQTLHIRA